MRLNTNWLLMACTLLLTSISYSQIRSSTLVGSVKDTAGGVMANAEIVVTNQDTNITDTTRTTEAGQFTAPYLPAGTYSVFVSAPGFAPYRQTGIVISPSQTVRLDVTLTVGSVESIIEVSAPAVQLQVDSSTLQAATSESVIAAIPNINQNPFYYATLQAGVVPRRQMSGTMAVNSFGIGSSGRNAFSAFSINGGNAFTNEVQLDGLSILGGDMNGTMAVPNTEGLQEVRVITNNFNAEYGRGHGIVSLSTKAGTNQFHGQLSYRLRNEALNANLASNNANSINRGPFKIHEFGAAVGGPIKRDKLFFFTSFHGLRHDKAVDWLLTVPTELERKGDFRQSFVRDPSGAPLPAQIFDPWNVTQLGPDLYRRAAYPGAVIPNPDPHAMKIMSYYPLPNRTPDDAFQRNNFGTRTIQRFRRQSENSRIDYRKGAHSIYGSGGISRGAIRTGRPFGADSPFLPSGRDNVSDKNPYGQIGDTVVLSPTVVLDVRFGATRVNTTNFGSAKSGYNEYDAIGVPKSVQAVMPLPGAAPTLVPSSGGGSGGNYSPLSNAFTGKFQGTLMRNVAGSITKVRGKWTHKAGGEFRNLLTNYFDPREDSVGNGVESGGNYTFEYTTAVGGSAIQNVNPVQRGFNGAGLLTGAGYWNIRVRQSIKPALGQRYYALFSQNDWRATSKLTVNLGLRWDVQPPPTERYNQIASLDLAAANAWGSRGALAFAGIGGYDRHLWETQWKDFGPRLGAAYRVTPTMVMRGGFGVSSLPSNTGFFGSPGLYGAAPFGFGSYGEQFGPNPHGVPVGRFSEDAPTRVVYPIGADPTNPGVYGASGDSYFLRGNQPTGKVAQWNYFLEKRFSNNWFVSAGYNASHSWNLIYSYFPYQSLQNVPSDVLAGWRDEYIASNGKLNPANQQVRNPLQPTSGPLVPFQGEHGRATVRRQVLFLPYPLLSGTSGIAANGYSDFHSLVIRVERMLSNGLQVSTNYTWSKTLDMVNTAPQDTQERGSSGGVSPDTQNLRNNRRYSFNDIPHRFVATTVWDLPVGPGRALSPNNRVASALVGNWQIGSVIVLQSGQPFSIRGADSGATLARPDRLAGVPIEVPKELQRWYDGATTVTLPSGRRVTPPRNTFLKYSSDAFRGRVVTTPNGSVVPDVFWWGTAASTYGDMRGPGRFNVDLTLKRVFTIREGIRLELAADATNLLNNTQYNSDYNGALGGTNLQTNAARGLVPGIASSDSFGTLGLSTYDPRQVQLSLRLWF